MMWGSTTTREQLRESINHLRKLNQVPERPKENILVSRHSNRQLSISRENEITSNLAFLSAISENSLEVMAVCIEEYPNGKGITIRIASNTGDLLEVTGGFRTLAGALEQAARRENLRDVDKNALFQQVITLDLYRILSRLRSRQAKKTSKTIGKKSPIVQLSEALYDKGVKARPGFTALDLKNLRAKSQALQVLFDKLERKSDLSTESIDVGDIIGDIVKAANDINKTPGLTTALQTFSGNPSLKRHLPEAFGKLGRYYSASSELVCAARDKTCRVFENIQVEPFQVLLSNTVQGHYKVHAEIQLLLFYELHPNFPRPRIICSSKSACYLCNLFFQIYGGFKVPQTHGKLYEKWILPDWLDVPTERRKDLGLVTTQLKATLDNKIQLTLRSKKIICHHPNESILPPNAHWPSSSALSGKLTPRPSASTSTLRPSYPPIRESILDGELPPSINLPLIPPKTPPERHAAASSNSEMIMSSRIVDLEEDAGNIATWGNMSLITIGYNEFP